MLLRQTKVEQLDPLFGDQDVVGLEIAMRDAFLMRGIESIQNLPRIFNGLFGRQRPFERSAFDELHHEVVVADIVKLADIRMIQGRDGSRFALETFGELFLWKP